MCARKKGLPEVIVRAERRLHRGAKTKVRAKSELSEEFWMQIGVHEGCVFLPLLFATAIDVITENATERLMNAILHPDKIVFMSESMENLRKKIFEMERGIWSKELKLNIRKTKVIVNG